MKKKLPYKTIIICSVILILYFTIYTVLTPFIRGVVIDAETKKPVENAWVVVTIDKGVRTIAGEVGTTRMISAPHTRTNKDGRFYVPPRLYFSIPTPFTFGMTTERLIITVRVADSKRAQINLSKNLWKWWFSTKIPVTHKEIKGEDQFKELQDLYDYCTKGAFLLVAPKDPGGCDNWELDYTIAEHEKFLSSLKRPNNADERTYYSSVIGGLAYLYKRRGDLKKALDYLITARDFDKKRGVDWGIKETDTEINKLKEKLKEK